VSGQDWTPPPQGLFILECIETRIHRRGAEDAEGAQRKTMLKPLRFLRGLCASAVNNPLPYAQV